MPMASLLEHGFALLGRSFQAEVTENPTLRAVRGITSRLPVTRDFARRGQVQHSEAAFAHSGSGEIVLDLATIL